MRRSAPRSALTACPATQMYFTPALAKCAPARSARPCGHVGACEYRSSHGRLAGTSSCCSGRPGVTWPLHVDPPQRAACINLKHTSRPAFLPSVGTVAHMCCRERSSSSSCLRCPSRPSSHRTHCVTQTNPLGSPAHPYQRMPHAGPAPVMSRPSAAGGGRCGVPSVTSARTPACGAPGVAGGESKPSGSPTNALPSHPPAEWPSRVTCVCMRRTGRDDSGGIWTRLRLQSHVTCAQPLSRLAVSTVSRTLFKYHLQPSSPLGSTPFALGPHAWACKQSLYARRRF